MHREAATRITHAVPLMTHSRYSNDDGEFALAYSNGVVPSLAAR